MTARRPPKSPRARRPAPSSLAVRTLVLLEDMRAENKMALENTLALGERMDRQFAEVKDQFEGVKHQFAAVAVRLDRMDARFDGIDSRFDHVDGQLRSLREEVARKADGAALVALDQRVTLLERSARP